MVHLPLPSAGYIEPLLKGLKSTDIPFFPWFSKAMMCCSHARCLFVFLPSVWQSPTELLEPMSNFKQTCPKTQRWEVPTSTVTMGSRAGGTKQEWAISWCFTSWWHLQGLDGSSGPVHHELSDVNIQMKQNLRQTFL